MCMHFVFAVAAPDEKGGFWKLIFLLLALNSEIGHSHRATQYASKNSQKGSSQKILFMISDVILCWCRSGMITKHLSFCACTNPISR